MKKIQPTIIGHMTRALYMTLLALLLLGAVPAACRRDAFAFLTTVVANGAAFGLPQTMVPCLTFFVLEDTVCDKPKEYMFWDAIHPTTATHAVLAGEVEKALNGQ